MPIVFPTSLASSSTTTSPSSTSIVSAIAAAPSSLPSAPVVDPVSILEPSSLPQGVPSSAQNLQNIQAFTTPHRHSQQVPRTYSPQMSATAVAGPSTPSNPWKSSHFYIDIDPTPALSPSLPAAGYSRSTSEPPQMPDTVQRPRSRSRSRSVSRTPSLPPSGESQTDLKSLPVTPKVQTPSASFTSPEALHARTVSSPCVVECPPPDTRPSLKATPHSVLGLGDVGRSNSAPVTPKDVPRLHMTYTHPSRHTSEALNSTEYTDLFLLEPHEYDLITDGELVRLYDRGVIDGRVLEQIVDASIRIQRACTVADRAVSIKTRRAMIRHALEE